jgi:microcystin-dependent protein
MFKFIRSLFIVLICMSYGAAVSAQDAAILPPAKTTFFGNDGKPLTSGKVYFYVPNTTTLKTTWQDANENVANSNPVVLDASGRAIIYGNGIYRQVVRDRNNNLIWDAVTASVGTGGSTGSGDTEAVGTIKAFAGFVPPSGYLFAYGQEVSRSTYATLFTAITLTTSAFCTNGSPILTGLTDTTQIPVGSPVEINCMAPGTTVSSKTSNTVTVNNNASLTTSSTAVFLPWGGGNGTNTFNIPDLRGRVFAGRDNMGGTAASRLTSTYYGIGADAIGAAGGAQSKVLVTANLPPYTPAGTNSTSTFPYAPNSNFTTTASSGGIVSVTSGGSTATVGAQTFTGTAQGGTSTAFSIIQPSITTNYVIKVTTGTGPGTGTVTSVDLSMPSIFTVTGNPITTAGTLVVTASGTSGGIPYFSSSTGLASSAVLTANLPVIGGGAGAAPTVGTRSGNTTKFVTTTGTLTSGNCAEWDASGNLVQASAACGTGGGTPGGSNTQVQFNSSGSFGGSANLSWISPALTVGAAGSTTGQLKLTGSTSGTITVQGQAAAGTYNFNLPATVGASGDLLTSAAGTTNPMTWTTPGDVTKTDDTNVTLTLGGTSTGAAVKAFSMTLGWTGTLAAGRLNSNVVQGVTNDTNVTGSISAQNLTLGWTGTLSGTRGGTGVNNGSNTITLGGNFTTSGAFTTTLTTTGNTNVTLPTSGTLVNTAVTTLSSLASIGTITTGTWNGTTIAVANGGTGQTSYTNGQLLIGNSTGNTLSKATLTAGANITITNGAGTITIASSGGGGSGCNTSGSATQVLTDNGAGGCSSNPEFVYSSGTATLGSAGAVVGALALNNATSGTVTIQPVTGALGTTTVSVPSASGTMAVSASSPLSLNATTGALTCSTCLVGTPSALTRVDDTNVTLTLGGTPTTALLQATSLTLGWTGQLGLTRGGTAASLTADNGGIVYSTSSALAILVSTATAGKHLQSGASAAPSWTTATFPATATGTGTFLRADGTNWVASTMTLPNTSSAGTILASATANTVTATATPTLGVAGTTVGDLTFANATSGGITIRPVTGALGSAVLTLPAAIDTVAVLAASQAFTNKTYNGNTWTAGTGTLTIAAGKTLTYNNSITMAGTDSTTMTFPSSSGTISTLNLTGQTITGGVIVTSLSKSTGSITVDCGARPLQYITASTSAWVITAPANDGSCILLITNPASAQIPTFSGFSVGSSTGDALTSTNTSKFSIHIWRVNGTSGYRVAAHQ